MTFTQNDPLDIVASNNISPSVSVSPDLGQGFGNIITVEGHIPIQEKRSKADEGKTLFQVTKVEGKAIDNPVTLPLISFSFHPVTYKEPGQTMTLLGYETGSFVGIPPEAFDTIPMVATERFSFRSSFQVLKVQ